MIHRVVGLVNGESLRAGQKAVYVFVFIAGLLLTGCTGAPPIFQGMDGAAMAETDPATVTSDDIPDVELSVNRLLVIGTDGNLYSIDPDGERRLALTSDAGDGRSYLQPTWSPSGERIATAEVRNGQSRLVSMKADGSDRIETELPFAPFYLFWNPIGEQIAYLSNWVVGGQNLIALRVVDYENEPPTVRTLQQGQPLYFSWSPDGEQMLIHVNNDEVLISALDGEEVSLGRGSGNFAAPQWSGVRNSLFYAVNDDGLQRMIVSDVDGTELEQITYFNGAAAFLESPSGRRAAFTDTTVEGGFNALGPLTLYDFETTTFEQISTEPSVGFFWSPVEDRLLYFTVDLEARVLWLRAHVWSPEGTVSLDRFRPTSIFIEQYLRFSDQYAQSLSLWSPDGSQVVFASQGENGRRGIWVQDSDGSGPSVRVATGLFASWTPR